MSFLENRLEVARKIIDHIRTEGCIAGNISGKQLGEIINVPKTTVNYYLKALIDVEVLKLEGERSRGRGKQGTITLKDEFKSGDNWKEKVMRKKLAEDNFGNSLNRQYREKIATKGSVAKKIVEYLRVNGGQVEATGKKISSELGISQPGFSYGLKMLIKANIVSIPQGCNKGPGDTLFVLEEKYKEGDDWFKLITKQKQVKEKPKQKSLSAEKKSTGLNFRSKSLKELIEVYEALKSTLKENSILKSNNETLKRENKNLKLKNERLEEFLAKAKKSKEEERQEVVALNKRIIELRSEVGNVGTRLRFDSSGVQVCDSEL